MLFSSVLMVENLELLLGANRRVFREETGVPCLVTAALRLQHLVGNGKIFRLFAGRSYCRLARRSID